MQKKFFHDDFFIFNNLTIFNKNSNKNNIQNIFDNKYKSSNKKIILF